MGRETTSATAIITSDTEDGSQKDRQHYREQNNIIRRIRTIETESNKSSEDEKFIKKMTDKIKIYKTKTIKQKYHNTIQVRIRDIDVNLTAELLQTLPQFYLVNKNWTLVTIIILQKNKIK